MICAMRHPEDYPSYHCSSHIRFVSTYLST
jgi:hypothetical protein